MKDMTNFQQDPSSCSASGPDVCPKWHYCNVSSNRCKPCTDCTGDMARSATSDHCQKPLTCSEGKSWKCRNLYIKRPSNGKMTNYSAGYLGSTVITRCYVNNKIQEEKLQCRLNDMNNELEWFGNFTCVTLEPPHTRETPTATSVPVTEFNTTTPNTVVGMIIPVAVGSVAAFVIMTVIITACFLLQKYKNKQLTDNLPGSRVQEVLPLSSDIHSPSATLCPIQNDNSSWHSSHQITLGSSQNHLSVPIQESQRPDPRQEDRAPSPSLSVHLPVDEYTQCRLPPSTTSCEETRPKLFEPELESLLQGHDAAMDDADFGVHLMEHERGQLDSPGDAMLASRTRPCSIESPPSERRSLALSSDLCDRLSCTLADPVLRTSSCSVCGVTRDQTRVKTCPCKEPVEHSWTDSVPGISNSTSQSQSCVTSLSIGSSYDSDIVLHDVRQTATGAPCVDTGISNAAIPGDYGTDFVCSTNTQRIGGYRAPDEFRSDSLLMKTSPSLSDLNERTHSLTRTESQKQESEDSGINSKSTVGIIPVSKP